ncbi:MAG: hypothetical protein ACLR5Y_01900 [Haemophilus parainfluenzae]
MYPEQGEILFDGQDICRLSNRELYEVRKRMGMLFQSGALFTDISRLITWHFRFASIPFARKSNSSNCVDEIRSGGLTRCGRFNAFELSGMARRAALARAMHLIRFNHV